MPIDPLDATKPLSDFNVPPNTPPLLLEAWHRFDRVNKHFEELHREILAFEQTKHHVLNAKLNPKRTAYIIEARADPVPDGPWMAAISDLADQCRAVLDNTVYAVTEPIVRRPSEKLCFPIIDNAAELHGWKYAAAIADIPEPYKTLVHDLQPCNGSKGSYKRARALVALRVLSNRDKHRYGHTMTVNIDATKRWGIFLAPLRDVEQAGAPEQLTRHGPIDGAKVLKMPVRITGPNPEVDVQDNIATYVAFGDRVATVRDQGVALVIDTIATEVLKIWMKFLSIEP